MSHRHRLLAGLALLLCCAGCGGDGVAGGQPSASSAGATSSTPSGPASGTATVASTAPPVDTLPVSGLSPVPSAVTTARAAVALTATSDFGHRVTARISKHESTTSVAHGPGQIGGAPAVSFTVTIDNGGTEALALDGVTVTASYGEQSDPATLSDGSAPFHGQLAAGASTSGSYVFEIPAAERAAVTITVSYSPGEPTVVFTGPVR